MLWTDKSALLASERQQPMTAAEHAQAHGHQAEYIRDVAQSCTCPYLWDERERRYVRISFTDGCPWTTPGLETI